MKNSPEEEKIRKNMILPFPSIIMFYSKLPSLCEDWKERSHSIPIKKSIKFELISKESLPYISVRQPQRSLHKSFKKIGLK